MTEKKRRKIVATIEARMTSTRLPGKALLPALGRPLIGHLIDRVKTVSLIDEIVLATTDNDTDDVLAEFAANESISVFRGSEDDVLGRVVGAAQSANADVLVQLSGDCPLIDPDVIEQTIRVFQYNPSVQFCANAYYSSYPDGMDTAVLDIEILERSAEMTTDELDREHVVRFIVNRPELFSHLYLIAPPSMTWPGLGLTLDEQGDYELICRLIEHFGAENPLFGCGEIIDALRQNSDWLALNDSVQRKNLRPVYDA